MTHSDDLNDTANINRDSGYYAVDARRVIQVFEMFQMRPSHFAASGKAGAQGVYYDAKKIIDGRTDNKWGHHTPRAIEDFCHFTQSENGTLLPWRELIEHRDFYDGKEGAGPRTGNLLLTENRVRLKHEAIINARQQQTLSVEQLAARTALPIRFIEVIEIGDWETVTKTTAEIIATALDLPYDTLFSPLANGPKDDKSDAINTEIDHPTIRNERMKKLLVFFILSGFVLLAAYLFYPLSQKTVKISQLHSNTSGLPGCWNWSNGAYIVIDLDGTAHLGLIGAHWKTDDLAKGLYTITWPSFVDTLTLSADSKVLSGSNNYGIPISATRKSGTQKSLIGTWLWSNGVTVKIMNDSVVNAGALSGEWYKAGEQWVIEWPLVDTITLSKDGKTLGVKSQFGSVTAKRDVDCKGK